MPEPATDTDAGLCVDVFSAPSDNQRGVRSMRRVGLVSGETANAFQSGRSVLRPRQQSGGAPVPPQPSPPLAPEVTHPHSAGRWEHAQLATRRMKFHPLGTRLWPPSAQCRGSIPRPGPRPALRLRALVFGRGRHSLSPHCPWEKSVSSPLFVPAGSWAARSIVKGGPLRLLQCPSLSSGSWQSGPSRDLDKTRKS